MRSSRFNLLACSLLVVLSVHGQERKELTLSDAVLKAQSTYAPESLNALQWVPGTDRYSYVVDSMLFISGIGKAADMPLATVRSLNESLPDSMPLKRFPSITWDDANTFYFWHRDRMFVVNTRTSAITEKVRTMANAENVDVDPKQHNVAFTMENDLYIALPGKEGNIRVTNDGGDGTVNGKSVHREEYGITKGTFWSPKGNALAFYRMDESMVSVYDLEDISTKPSTFEKLRYPMAGQASHHVTIGVYDVRKGRTLFLQTGEPMEQYLTNIAWGPNEDRLYVVHLDRATENLRVVEYDVETGRALRDVLTEHSDVYLEPEHPMRFLEKSPKQFLWHSDRDGWDHVYLYDLKKGLIRQLTKGNWTVTDVLGFDTKEEYLIVEGTAEVIKEKPTGATENHIYRVDVATGNTVRLTKDAGTHHAQLSSDGTRLLDTWSSLTVPGRTDLLTAEGQILKTLKNADDPLKEVRVGTIELLTIKGENGNMLNARIIKPSDFDPKRKYPVLVYVYNGPHVQLVRNNFLGGASLWMLHAAERGYIVFTVDGHGSGNRSRDLEQTIHRRMGTVEVKDQLHGVEYLRSLPFVDAERMGVHGWSYGGYMTVSLMVKAPGAFKVGVAGGPVMDWHMYEVMYTERYMDTPEENPEGYAEAALPDKCSQLQGELLIIHGLQDNVVVPEHSYTFLKSCVDQGKQVEFFVYPGHPHNVRGKDRPHLMTQVLDRFDRTLKP